MNLNFLEKAYLNEPQLYEETVKPVRFGIPVPDDSQWFQYRFEEKPAPELVHAGESFYIDFGDHYTGHLSFRMCDAGNYPDAPVKVHVKFAENIYELEYDFDTYNGGLVSSWLQEETIYIDSTGVVKLPRRYAFRYIKFTMDTRGLRRVPMKFVDFELLATTSADESSCKPFEGESELKAIDKIGCRTLRECMQRVFEDGPKRDRRLWVGDLRVQALTGYYAFPTESTLKLIRKCLYLFAAHTKEGDRVPQAVIEDNAGSHSDGGILVDYALLYVVTMCDYFEHTKDASVVDDLFALADKQLRIAWEDSDENIVRDKEGWWTFVDWCDGLRKTVSLQGVLLYTLKKMICLCEQTGRMDKAEEYKEKQLVFSQAAMDKLYNKETKFFQSVHDNHQLSVHSQVWMILGGVVEGAEAKELLLKTLDNKEALRAVSPYMHHYVLEAMFLVNMKEEAKEYLKAYWGEMVRRGADTYWEVFVPDNFEATLDENCDGPVINSSCHAWSCSASYFVRKYFA